MNARLAILVPLLAVACSSTEDGTSAKGSLEADAGPNASMPSPPTLDAAPEGAVPTTPSPAATVDEACTRYTEALCGALSAHCSEPMFRAQYGDLAQCKSFTKRACVQLHAAEQTAWTPAGRIACANAIAATTNCHDLNNSWARIRACVPPAGPRAFAAPCIADAQCATGVCVFTTMTCGTCANKVPAGGLCGRYDLCADAGYECVCVGDGCPESRCMLTRNAGEACDAQHICSDENICRNGACAPTPPGTSCSKPLDCAYPLVCNTKTDKCEPRVVAQPGASCGPNANGGWSECAGSVCNFPDAEGPGTCSTVALDGTACDAARTCQVGSTCVNGFCMPPVQVVCN